MEDVTEDLSLSCLIRLKSKLNNMNFSLTPNNYATLESLDDGTNVDVELLWIDKKVGICLNENKAAYEALKNSDWSIFYLDENFDVEKFAEKLKEN